MDNNGGRIHLGGFDEIERNRLLRSRNDDTISIASDTTIATTTFEKPKPQAPRGGDLVFSHSQESLEAKKKQEELNKKMELQKKAKNILVPTNENEVKAQLREMKHPVTYFGETAADRRERLRQLLAKTLIETGAVPAFKQTTTSKKEEESSDYYLYEGPPELRAARLEIAKYSMKQAAIRVEKNKIRRETTDPIEEEELIDRELEMIPKFEISMSQFADSSCASKGCFSSDGKYFATSGWSGLCKIWSVPDCNLQTTLLGHINRAIDIQFNPLFGQENTKICLASSGADNSVRLWPFEQGEEFQKATVLKGHDDRVNKVRFHPMGKHVISSSHDKTWKLWDMETQKALFTQTGHTKPVFACSVQPDGSLVFTGDCGGYGMLWDLRTGKSILPLVGHVKQIISSDFHVNGYHLVTCSDDNTVRFWDIRRKNCFNILPAHTKLISDVKFQPGKGRFVATASYDKTCKIWSSKDWTLSRTLIAHDSKVTSISISEDMQYLATTSLDRKWMLWAQTKKADGNIMLPE